MSSNGTVFCCGQLLLQVPDALSLGCHLLLSLSQGRLCIMASLHSSPSASHGNSYEVTCSSPGGMPSAPRALPVLRMSVVMLHHTSMAVAMGQSLRTHGGKQGWYLKGFHVSFHHLLHLRAHVRQHHLQLAALPAFATHEAADLHALLNGW